MTKTRVLVLGDVMLDVYTRGASTRLSPEAPVPVLAVGRSADEENLGGAGNVAANVASLGGQATLVALVGDDDAARRLEWRVDAVTGLRSRLVVDGSRPTTVKHRFVADGRHLLRVDAESDVPPDERTQELLMRRYAAALGRADAVVLSDYAKGVLAPPTLGVAVSLANERGVPVVVDPKRYPLNAYRAATAITPNIHEAMTLSGVGDSCTDEGAAAAGTAILTRGGFQAVAVTRSERGVTLVERTKKHGSLVTHHPSLARRVVDVTGAGDSFVAAFALELGRGASYEHAVRRGQEAAAVAVGSLGTVAVKCGDGTNDAGASVEELRSRGLKIGFVNGCFDCLHAGHIHLIRRAREGCDRLIVAVNDDESVALLNKEHPLIQPLEDRMAVLAALADVNGVVAFSDATPLTLIQAVRPDVLFRGDDGSDVVGAEHCGRVVRVPLLAGRSTTATWRRTRAA